MKKQNVAIGVFGHYGNKNLGDESIIEAVIDNIRKRAPEAIIFGFSIVPEDTEQRHGVESYPIRYRKPPSPEKHSPPQSAGQEQERPSTVPSVEEDERQGLKAVLKSFTLLKKIAKIPLLIWHYCSRFGNEVSFLLTSFQRAKKLDILMITGSNQFLDNFGGPWGFPYTLLKWSILAKLAGTKVCYVSVGAGPISANLSKYLIGWAIRFSDYVSLRDISSQNLIREIYAKKETMVYPDVAHSLDISKITPAPLPEMVSRNEKILIGINPMPLYDSRYWCEKDDGKYKAYVDKLVDFCCRLKEAGHAFYFFATQEKDNNVIIDVLEQLEKTSNEPYPFNGYTLTSSSVTELMSNIAAADVTIATRFHGTVLSLLSEKPMLGICYYRKAKELLMDMGQQDYAVELDTFTIEDLWHRFEKLVVNVEREREKIILKNKLYLDSLNEQYDKLLGDT